MSSINPSKITPEQKKFIQTQTTSSVFTEQEISESNNPAELIAINEATIAGLNVRQIEVLEQVQEDASLFIQGPTRAQDQFSLRQASTALMSQVPRQKFEYLATFRFASDTLFQTIFSDDRIEGLDQAISSLPGNTIGNSKTVNNLKQSRAQVLDAIRRSLVFNIKQIDGPKVNFQYDTLNQYNRKRNVYRRVDYDPVNIRFYDTMDNSALKLFRYLYELNLKDGRNRNKEYGGETAFNKGLYQSNPISSESDFITQHNFGLDSSISNTTYPIKSLDLFLIHGGKYNLIRFVHPKIIAMDHDVLTYEASAPVEIGMQFAYETIVYETLNYDMATARDVTINFDEILANSLPMPNTPGISIAPEGSNGSFEPNFDWSEVAANLSNFTTANSQGGTISENGSSPNNSSASAISNTGASFGNAYATAKKTLTANNYVANPSSNSNGDKLTKDSNGNVANQ